MLSQPLFLLGVTKKGSCVSCDQPTLLYKCVTADDDSEPKNKVTLREELCSVTLVHTIENVQRQTISVPSFRNDLEKIHIEVMLKINIFALNICFKK